MSSSFTAAEIRDLICRLERLERAQAQTQAESELAQQKGGKGYTRGDPRQRAAAVGPLTSQTVFPAISQVSKLWTCVEEVGPDFLGDQSVRVEDGPGPVPALVEDQADFICSDQREGIQRVQLAFATGFWARVALEVFSEQISDQVISSPAKHFIVLRACGLGGSVRFVSEEDFSRFLDQTVKGGLLAHGFATQTELEVFCQGAKIAVPPAFKPAC